MSTSIFIIHLSDLHIDPYDPAESRPVYRDLCQKIIRFRNQKRTEFQLLLISGDLVNQGAEDYAPVEKILEDILIASGLSRNRVFMVPGNHDVTRHKCTGTHRHVTSSLKREPCKEFTKLDHRAKLQLYPGFQAYSKFSGSFPLHSSNQFDVPGFAQADIDIAGVPIRLCGINSALVSGPDDAGKEDNQLKDRVAGRQLVWKMLDADDRLKLVVSHYPLSWLHVDEQKEVINRLEASNALFFHGHTHEPSTDIEGITRNRQMFVLGVGSLYGEKWQGRNHCQILELSFNNPLPLLHEWFWSGEYGWRGFEPLEINWTGWDHFRQRTGCQDPLPDIPPDYVSVGLVNIGKGRSDPERWTYYKRAMDSATDGTDFIALGRSLIDLARYYKDIEDDVNRRSLHVKIGILDENTLLRKNEVADAGTYSSWIEKPIPQDWAMSDVPISMDRFRRIEVRPGSGSLEIYGLPFYLSHSFIAFTSRHDGLLHCLEETGMALEKGSRPFIELKAVSNDSYASTLQRLYASLLTENRLLIRNDGTKSVKDTTQRAKIIAGRAERLGLVDLSVGRSEIDWYIPDVAIRIKETPEGGEIFIVGRSLLTWANHYRALADAIIDRHVSCIFVMADPMLAGLKSLVANDYAEKDISACWNHFSQDLIPLLAKQGKSTRGLFKLYGIPAYVPDTFAVHTKPDGTKFCILEPGINADPASRTVLCFKNVSDIDIYTSLNNIYRGIIEGREPLLQYPPEPKGPYANPNN